MAPKKKRKCKRSAITLLGTKGLTRNHVRKVMNALGDEPLTRKQVELSFNEACDEVYHSDIAVQICLELEEGDSFDWDVASPAGVLRDRAKSSTVIGRFFRPWKRRETRLLT